MKKCVAVLAGLGRLLVCGCANINLSGTGNIGDASVGAHINPLSGDVGVNAGAFKTIKAGGVETTVHTSSDGHNLNVDTDVQADEE